MMAQGHKLKNMKLHLSREKQFFPMSIVEHCHSLPRKAVKSPSLEILKRNQNDPGQSAVDPACSEAARRH